MPPDRLRCSVGSNSAIGGTPPSATTTTRLASVVATPPAVRAPLPQGKQSGSQDAHGQSETRPTQLTEPKKQCSGRLVAPWHWCTPHREIGWIERPWEESGLVDVPQTKTRPDRVELLSPLLCELAPTRRRHLCVKRSNPRVMLLHFLDGVSPKQLLLPEGSGRVPSL